MPIQRKCIKNTMTVGKILKEKSFSNDKKNGLEKSNYENGKFQVSKI